MLKYVPFMPLLMFALIPAGIAWFLAQAAKAVQGKSFLSRKGMPSGHVAFVVALALSLLRTEAFSSTVALALGLAFIVAYDASARHKPVEIIGGAVLGCAIALLL